MHAGTTSRCKTQRRNPLRPERPQPDPLDTGGTFHRRLQPLYTEKHKVSFSGFLPNTSPSHYNAFCSITWLTRMYLHAWQHQMTTIMQPLHWDLQPQIQETHRTTHTGTTSRCRTQRRNPLRPEGTGGTFHCRLQPLYTEKHKLSCSGFLPTTKPMQHSWSHYIVVCSIT